MLDDTLAVLSLGANTTKDTFMQAAGRLRKLGRNQSIQILTTQEVLSSVSGFPKDMETIRQKLKNTDIK